MVAAPVYATVAEYHQYVDDSTFAPPDRLLARASRIVDEVLFGALYDVDADDLPTDPDVAAALRDATSAQVDWLRANGDTTGAGGVPVVQSATIGSISFTGATRTPAGRTRSGAEVAPEVPGILEGAGLRLVVSIRG